MSVVEIDVDVDAIMDVDVEVDVDVAVDVDVDIGVDDSRVDKLSTVVGVVTIKTSTFAAGSS